MAPMTSRVEFFGVRHHSPAAALHVVERLRRDPPAAVLIEGPSDFNDQLDELDGPHTLPIMIYHWAPADPDALDGTPAAAARHTAYYPLCDYSPEWTAFREARVLGIETRFIDLPWHVMADVEEAENRFAEPELDDEHLRSAALVMDMIGVDSLSDLVDEAVEVDPDLGLDEFQRRMELIGSIMRRLRADDAFVQREVFMAARIAETLERVDGTVLVVCGAAHIDGLRAELEEPGEEPPITAPDPDDRRYGAALTPTSYAYLDQLTGYNAGQPNPGFYDRLFRDRSEGRYDTAERVLSELVTELRGHRQRFSSADLVAVLTTARGLASLRGHEHLWRTDLLDAITSALVKEESGPDHPLLQLVHEHLRGDRVGELAEGTTRPPLVLELLRELRELELEPEPKRRVETADLTDDRGLRRSRLLHSLDVLQIPMCRLLHEADETGEETWEIVWTPAYEGELVAAARWGGTREQAVGTVLADRLGQTAEGDVRAAAELVVEAALCGLHDLGERLQAHTERAVRETGDVENLGEALRLLMHVYRYDPLLRVTGRADLGRLVALGFDRAVRLLERLGPLPHTPESDGVVTSIRIVTDVAERCGATLALDTEGWDRALATIVDDDAQAPQVRGAALGARWLTGASADAEVAAGLHLVTLPEHFGDFVSALLWTAREACLRRPDLILELDAILSGMGTERFLTALPGLRRAFSEFSSRERAQVAQVLLGSRAREALQAFGTSDDERLMISRFEAELMATMTHFLGERTP